jgi:hypothetical protein
MAGKIECPICQTKLPADMPECPVCGARLADRAAGAASSPDAEVRQQPSQPASSRRLPAYDPALGEDDLYAPGLLRFPWWGILFPIVIVGALVGGLALLGGVALSQQVNPRVTTPTPFGGRTAVPTLALNGPAPTNGPSPTPMPTLMLQTITPLPPTPTPTETPGPCEQIVGQGDNLIILATRCGHNDLDVIDEILDLNGLSSAESLQLGQLILIPWPSPTPGPPPTDEASDQSDAAGGSAETVTVADVAEPTAISNVIPSPTLQPGVGWYTIQAGDNILSIAIQFNANVEILSQLNPEVTFSQCDFGMDSGGANCIVQLYEGQRIRVPAPTPTPTLSPTPSGSETPTPTATPTFNAPSLLSPGDRFLFGAEDIVTLRWVTTGILAEGDVYLVTVTDTTLGEVFTTATTETLLILPQEWQPTDGERHLFTWDVAVGPSNGSGGLASVTFNTPSRMFFWDSR